MARISLADKRLERFVDLPEHEADYLLAYDFRGVRIPTSFYSNLGSVLRKFRHEGVQLSLLRLARTGCQYEIKFEPKPRWSGELRCPNCGEMFNITRLDEFAGP